MLELDPRTAEAADVVTLARWFGPEEAPVLGWLTTPAAGPTASGVLFLAPVGYEWWPTHGTLRALAERLAGSGHTVLRFDYQGTGDSAGTGREEDQVAAWRAGARAADAELREIGCERVVIVGARLGGLLALEDAAELGADAVVAWEPPASGKRFARELRMLSEPVPDEEGTMSIAGSRVADTTLAQLEALDPLALEARPAPRVALVGAGLDRLASHLESLGAAVTAVDPPGATATLGLPTEEATVAEPIVAALAGAVGPAGGALLPPAPERAEATFRWGAGRVTERVLRVGPKELVGVLTTPVDGPGRSIVVWLNSGSEPHVGSGRAWVEYARSLARRGHASLRLDFSGWGESPDLGHAPGRPYDLHGIEESVEAVEALKALGYSRIVLAGLCAGAWIALEAVLRVPVAGVVALNPQLYWEPGDPVEALMSETRERRAPAREREKRGGRLGFWSVLDRLGFRSRAGRRLDRLGASGVSVLLCFAEGDDGIEYLKNRLGRRLAQVSEADGLRAVEIPGIDHSMHRVWLRDRIVATVDRFLAELP